MPLGYNHCHLIINKHRQMTFTSLHSEHVNHAAKIPTNLSALSCVWLFLKVSKVPQSFQRAAETLCCAS